MRRPKLMFLGLLVAAASMGAAAQRPPAAKVTVFERARVIVGDGTPWIEDAAFVVEGTHFAQVGRRGTLKIPRGAARVNLAGKTVMPAPIDTLARVTGTSEEMAEQLRRRAQHGAAVVMSASAKAEDPLFQLRDETIPHAARLVAAGEIGSPEPSGMEVPATEVEARRMVQELAGKKVALVTIWADTPEGTQKKLSPALFKPIIEEAHAHGLRVMARVRTLQDTKDFLRAGVDVLAGVTREPFDKEVLDLFHTRPNVIVVANLSERGAAADFNWLRATLRDDELVKLQARAAERPDAQAEFMRQTPNLGWLFQQRVRIALGSDTAVPWGHLLEMDDMAAALLPPDVIVAAGHNAAQVLGLKDHGGIVPGNVANFIVLDGNPAMDIRQLGTIRDVYLRGNRTADASPESSRRPN